MAHALLFPEPEKGGRGKKTVQRLDSFSKQSLSNARAVLAFSPELGRQVHDGQATLAEAYEKVEAEAKRGASVEAQRQRLAKEAKDLLALVKEERLSVVGQSEFCRVGTGSTFGE